jgi:hypothetical protein
MDLLVMTLFSALLAVITFPIYWITINLALEYLK